MHSPVFMFVFIKKIKYLAYIPRQNTALHFIQTARFLCSPRRYASMFSAMIAAQRARASHDPQAACGVRQTFGKEAMAV